MIVQLAITIASSLASVEACCGLSVRHLQMNLGS